MKPPAAERSNDTSWRLAKWITVHTVLLLLTIAIVPFVVARFNYPSTAPALPSVTCTADGSAHISSGDDDLPQATAPWLYLSITLGFGSFSFSAAKLIGMNYEGGTRRVHRACSS